MKPSSILSTCMVAFATTTAAAPTVDAPTSPALFNSTIVKRQRNDPNEIPVWCERVNGGWGFTWRYDVYISNVPLEDWNEVCEALWAGLRKHQFLCMVSNPYCWKAGSPREKMNHILKWSFDVGLFCDAGCVASGYWEATKNKYGSMDQRMCW